MSTTFRTNTLSDCSIIREKTVIHDCFTVHTGISLCRTITFSHTGPCWENVFMNLRVASPLGAVTGGLQITDYLSRWSSVSVNISSTASKNKNRNEVLKSVKYTTVYNVGVLVYYSTMHLDIGTTTDQHVAVLWFKLFHLWVRLLFWWIIFNLICTAIFQPQYFLTRRCLYL